MSSLIELVDTAVKIGLGAAITGWTSYFISKRGHSHELSKEISEDRRILLRSIASSMETSSMHMNLGVGAWRKSEYKLASSEYLKAVSKNNEAKSLAGLLGLQSVLETLRQIHADLDEISLEFLEENPDTNNVNRLNQSVLDLREVIYQQLSTEYSSIRSIQ